MLKLLPDLPAHVVGFRLDGTVTDADMALLYRAVEQALERGKIHLYAEITGLGGLTLDALGTNVKRGMALLPRLGQVKRYAVVSDVGWIQSVASFEGAVIPGLTVRTWAEADADEALAWASAPVEA